MRIIGRAEEQRILEQCLSSGRPEFIAVYGRRRVGKTFLIREFFRGQFSFYVTGVPESGSNRFRLAVFHEALKDYGSVEKEPPSGWLEAFRRLKQLLSADSVYRDPVTGRRIVFIDELPWLDSPRSDFKLALDWFWNGWASSQEDLYLIVCGSATSWIIRHIISNTGGLYNRITRQIHLRPFTLFECEVFFLNNGIELPRSQIIEAYMVFGGIPYYLNYYSRRLSLAQNIQSIIFDETGPLFREHERLFRALFVNADSHWAVAEALSHRTSGTTRTEIAHLTGINNGAPLTRVLQELEECGFIRKYANFPNQSRESVFRLIDPYTLFYLTFIHGRKVQQWIQFITTPGYYAWAGHAFEMVCLHHIREIKSALGITGILSQESAWYRRGTEESGGAQIDLLIDRADHVINLCEIKHTEKSYIVTKEERETLLRRRDLFRENTGTRRALMLTLISSAGISQTGYWDTFQNIITGDDLFRVL